MQRADVMKTIDSYLIAKQAIGHTGKLLVEINMAQGGFADPKFSRIKPESAPMPAGLKFAIVD